MHDSGGDVAVSFGSVYVLRGTVQQLWRSLHAQQRRRDGGGSGGTGGGGAFISVSEGESMGTFARRGPSDAGEQLTETKAPSSVKSSAFAAAATTSAKPAAGSAAAVSPAGGRGGRSAGVDEFEQFGSDSPGDGGEFDDDSFEDDEGQGRVRGPGRRGMAAARTVGMQVIEDFVDVELRAGAGAGAGAGAAGSAGSAGGLASERKATASGSEAAGSSGSAGGESKGDSKREALGWQRL